MDRESKKSSNALREKCTHERNGVENEIRLFMALQNNQRWRRADLGALGEMETELAMGESRAFIGEEQREQKKE